MNRTISRLTILSSIAVLIATVALLAHPRQNEVGAGSNGSGPSLQLPFAQNYTLTNVGPLPQVLDFVGGITFPPSDPNTLVYGTSANDDEGVLNTIGVERDGDGHITGFAGNSTFLANADGNDGGADFAPNGTLFVTTYSDNNLLQYKPGSKDPDKTTDLSTLGITGSTGAVRFVPDGFDGAGDLKVIDYSDDAWYTVPVTEDGAGTYDLNPATLGAQFPGETGPESAVYVPPGREFNDDSILLAEFDAIEIGAYVADGLGNPIVGTRRTFISAEDDFGPAGMVRDPVTGDLVIADYYNAGIYVVQGFVADPDKGDLNCDNIINGRDPVTLLNFVAETDGAVGDGCPPIGEGYPAINVAGGDNIVGDMNCDNQVTVDDVVTLLLYLADLPTGINPLGGCKPIGSD